VLKNKDLEPGFDWYQNQKNWRDIALRKNAAGSLRAAFYLQIPALYFSC